MLSIMSITAKRGYLFFFRHNLICLEGDVVESFRDEFENNFCFNMCLEVGTTLFLTSVFKYFSGSAEP